MSVNRWYRYLSWALIPYLALVNASASLYYNQGNRLHSSSRQANSFRRSRRSHLALQSSGAYPFYPSTLLVARKKTKETNDIETKKKWSNEPEVLQQRPDDVSFDDLGPIGKVVASATELGISVLTNYIQGYLTGWIAGTAIGMPGFLFRPLEPGVPQLFLKEFQGRWVRMNTRSVRFGKSFGGLSAVFKGSDTAVRRLRYGKNDEWNDILGSAVAGAIFARKEGPVGMAKGALIWGGMIYLLNGGMRMGTSPISRYTEESIDF